jgi:hypothetical protein
LAKKLAELAAEPSAGKRLKGILPADYATEVAIYWVSHGKASIKN